MKQKKPNTQQALPPPGSDGSKRENHPCIVGVGASAGGVEALQKLFDAMPSDNGIAFVVIQHLDPNHQSQLAQVLGRHTDMQVTEAADKMTLEADHVYIIPPNRYLTIRQRALHVSRPDEPRGR